MAYIQLNQCGVTFDPATHTYLLGEKELSGITGVLERQLFPGEFDNIPEAVLLKAAEYGTRVHESIELFDAQWKNDNTPEVADYISLCRENDLTHEASEYLITDGENYASMIDKVYRRDTATFDLADIKTYGTMTPEKLEKARWQLSVYAYLFEAQNPRVKVDRILVIHLRHKTDDSISKLIPVKRIPSEICKELLSADLEGRQFVNPYAIPDDIREKEARIRTLMKMKEDAERELGIIKSGILSEMEAQDVRTWTTDTMRITRKLPASRSSFSINDFKAANPDIDLSPYMRTSQVAGSITISV